MISSGEDAVRRDAARVAEAPEQRMFFLVGRGRSGSSLLGRMLDNHPDLFVAPESLFVLNVRRRYRRARWRPRTVRRLVADVWREERMRRWRLERGEVERLLLAVAGAPDAGLARLCATIYAASAAAHGARPDGLLGDKNPHYALFLPELMELFPSARFVHLVRDYRDNVRSYRGVPFDLSSPAALAFRWRRYNQAVLAAAEGQEQRFHRLRFEDLVAFPEASLRGVCDFLEVPFEAATLVPHAPRQEESLDWHRHLGRPLDASLTGRWREELSRDEVALLDLVCQPLGAALGYPREETSAAARLPLAAHFGVALGRLVTAAERAVFRLPLEVRTLAIRSYRLATGNRIR